MYKSFFSLFLLSSAAFSPLATAMELEDKDSLPKGIQQRPIEKKSTTPSTSLVDLLSQDLLYYASSFLFGSDFYNWAQTSKTTYSLSNHPYLTLSKDDKELKSQILNAPRTTDLCHKALRTKGGINRLEEGFQSLLNDPLQLQKLGSSFYGAEKIFLYQVIVKDVLKKEIPNEMYSQILENWKKETDSGYASFNCGVISLIKRPFDEQAYEWFRRAAAKKVTMAKSFLGLAYYLQNKKELAFQQVEEEDKHSNQNLDGLIDYFLPQIKKRYNSSFLDLMLNVLYPHITMKKKVTWLEQSATKGNIFAQTEYGVKLYSNKNYYHKELPQAIQWLGEATYFNYAVAHYQLARLEYNTYKNNDKIQKHLRAAFANGAIEIRNYIFEEGKSSYLDNKDRGFWKNFSHAEFWLETAHRFGHPDALCILGHMSYEKGNVEEAQKLFCEAAKNKSTLAVKDIFGIGNSLASSWDDKKKKEAISWWKLASQFDSGEACYKLGTLALNEGKTKEALKWFSKAAKNKDASAIKFMYERGTSLYDKGKKEEAMAWLKAVAPSNAAYAYKLARLALTQRDFAEALQWFKEAEKNTDNTLSTKELEKVKAMVASKAQTTTAKKSPPTKKASKGSEGGTSSQTLSSTAHKTKATSKPISQKPHPTTTSSLKSMERKQEISPRKEEEEEED